MIRYVVQFFTLFTMLIFASCASGPGASTHDPEDLRADFQCLYEGLQSGHVALFANRSKDEYDTLYTEMLETFDTPLTAAEAYLEFQKFTAFGNVAHASVNQPGDAFGAFQRRGGRSFPIFPRIVDGVAYIAEDYSGVRGLSPGDRMIALNGEPMDVWLERLGQHVSADTPYIANSVLEFRLPRYLWAELGEVDSFELTVETADGEPLTADVPAKSWLRQRLSGAGQPSGFQIDGQSRVAKVLDDNIAYLRPGIFLNARNSSRPWDNRRFIAFIDSAFERFLEAGSDTLIIDLRENPGGDSTFSDHMVAWIADEPFRFASAFLIRSSDEAEAANAARLAGNPDAAAGVSGAFAKNYAETPRGEQFSFDIPYTQPREGRRFDGKVYVLINRHSYSQAVNVAATFQDYRLGTIAGEPSSDFATSYGSIETFQLPNTGLVVNFPKAHIIRPSGDTVPGGVVPDIEISSPIVPQPNDVVLEALLKQIESD
ncbi:MAG: S41 family peptidase [Pseudomonadota bacterium]